MRLIAPRYARAEATTMSVDVPRPVYVIPDICSNVGKSLSKTWATLLSQGPGTHRAGRAELVTRLHTAATHGYSLVPREI